MSFGQCRQEKFMAETMTSTASIVLVGSLNPSIIQPAWLRSHMIIGEAETEDAAKEVEIIHRDVSILNFRNMKLVVDSSRFSLTVLEPPFEKAKDFITSVFKLLSHTPSTAIGMNREIVFRCKDVDAWHKFGDKLAPKEPWVALLSSNESDEHNGGLRTMTMERSKRADGNPGYVRVEVLAQETGRPDTSLKYNDHHDLMQKGEPSTAKIAIDRLASTWDSFLIDSERVFSSLVCLAESEER
jgi:hypothetical protein